MCGIFSAFAEQSRRLDVDINMFRAVASDAMKRRGPDHFGFYTSEKRDVVIAHSRLAIQGRDAQSNQPFMCKSGGVLVYNGELYNANELADSHSIEITCSDTPIFAEAVIDKRVSLSEIDGMFSFVHYDERKKRVYAGRDVYGEKPLFRYKARGVLFLFSELSYTSLFPLFGIEQPKIDISFAKRLLLYGYRQAVSREGNISCRLGVEMIKAGTTLDIDLDGLSCHQKRFYNIKNTFINARPRLPFEQDYAYDLVSRRVGLRSISDVRTAVCLSGGIDSTLVAALLCEAETPPELALTLHSDDGRYSESEIAKQTARRLGIKHKLVRIDDSGSNDSAVNRFIELSGKRGSPFLTLTSFVSTYLYSASNSEGCSVLFSGIGGDELFSGYYDYFFYRMLSDSYTKPEGDAFTTHILPLLKNPILGNGVDALSDIKLMRHHYFDFESRVKLFLEPKQYHIPVVDYDSRISLLKQRMLADLTSEVVPIILYEDDLNAMYYSVENRSPLLSTEIMEYAVELSEASLMVDGYQKYPLRKLLERTGKANHVALNRRKVGFNFSFNDFLQTDPHRVEEIMVAESALWNVVNKGDALPAIWNSSLSETFRFMIFSLQSFFVMNGQ